MVKHTQVHFSPSLKSSPTTSTSRGSSSTRQYPQHHTPQPRPSLQSTMEAPLSSPALNQPSQSQHSYFSGSSQSSAPTSAPQTTQSQSQTQPQQIQQQRPVSDASATSGFLRDFNLVAEAAKRAQMAVLMRDMEAVGI